MKRTLNVALLEKVKAHILEEPNRLIMGNWIERNKPGAKVLDYGREVTTPECGTVGCIAGWCVLLSEGMDAKEIHSPSIKERATNLLGLKFTPYELFFTDSWGDGDLGEQFENSTDAKERAEIVAEVIDGFIAKYKGKI